MSKVAIQVPLLSRGWAARMLRVLLAYILDWVAFACSAYLAFELRFDGAVPAEYRSTVTVAVCTWCGAKAIAFLGGRVSRTSWRYASVQDALRILAANTAGAIIGGMILIVALRSPSVPRSVYVLDWLLSTVFTLGGRLLFQVLLTSRRSKRDEPARTRVLIYGAGLAGMSLLREFGQNHSLRYEPVGFLDDDPSKARLMLGGKPVLGTGEKLARVVEKYSVDRVLIAIPSATGAEMARILRLALEAKVECKAVPGLGELIEGAELGKQIRDVAMEDLLGRRPVDLDLQSIDSHIRGKVVLVTGAAGSIGSELCRQIARFAPRALIGFDEAETPLFHLQRGMAHHAPNLDFHPEIGSVINMDTICCAMERYRPNIVYHAAAYKHVPMMEMHAFAAVETNAFGTWNVARAAVQHGVEDFVLISTDKAVRPTSMMGATKRTAELIIRSMHNRQRTKFVAVRFGNVLGSNGSVVPIFKEQIAAGGPVTVTHPGVTRYFMTIPEAVQLILQAFTIGKGGELFVLEMGDPVRIADLATNLILLSGLRPGKDVEIRYTGLRPGEKMYEELHLTDEDLVSTSHPKIRIYASNHLPDQEQMESALRELRKAAERRDLAGLVLVLKQLIPDYNPGAQILQAALRFNRDALQKTTVPQGMDKGAPRSLRPSVDRANAHAQA